MLELKVIFTQAFCRVHFLKPVQYIMGCNLMFYDNTGQSMK